MAARRILKVPKGLAVRPTPDLVKQAVFNSLGGRVVGDVNAIEIVKEFLKAKYAGGRHQRRIDEIAELDQLRARS